ncbi:MAG TPA: hypothetical protein VM285_09420 [Polyangia bacterium]|nr:hypothetical protein [Polyangia bacterium]
MPRWLPLALLALVIALAAAAGWQERDRGRLEADLGRALTANEKLRLAGRRIVVRYQRDTVRLWRTLAHYDTARITDTVTRNDTVFVPRIVADNAVAACRAVITTCELRAANLQERIDTLESAVGIQDRLVGRPWTSAGLAMDARSGALGAYLDRDVWRIRLGGTIFPVTPTGAQLGVRVGVRW